jgi:CRP-like cAMP-binding protein
VKGISAEVFIRAWQTCATTDDVAEKLGCSVASATSRASKLRRMGIRLVKRYRARPHLDIDALKVLAASLAPRGGK